MKSMRKVEIFSAGCPLCKETIELISRIACSSCRIEILDMNDAQVLGRARSLGVLSVPAVAVDDRLAECCSDRGPDERSLRAAGVGTPMG